MSRAMFSWKFFPFLFVFLSVFSVPNTLLGQTLGIQSIPSDRYRATIALINDGDFAGALEAYQDELRGSIKFGQNRWIDVICYYAMIGECHFQMGNYPAAMENYDNALKYYMTFSNWLTLVDFDRGVGGSASNVPRGPTPWGASSRPNPMIRFPKSFRIKLGFEQLGTSVNRSGQSEAAIGTRIEYYPIYASELVEAMALSIRRRGEILGPLGKFDKLNDHLVETFQQRPYLPNHWSGAWIELCYGLALSIQGKDDEAHPLLDRSLIIMGTTDHPLTSTGFMGLGEIAMKAGDYPAAFDRFYEASIAAYYYGNSIVLEEAFRKMGRAQKMIDKNKPAPVFLPALAWADREKMPFLQFPLNMLIAEDLLLAKEPVLAEQSLARAWGVTNRRSIRDGRLNGYWNYLSAILSYSLGKIPEGDLKLQAAMNCMKQSSLWINQIRILEFLYQNGQITTSGPITPRLAMELYEQLLRDPTDQDWMYDPLEALTIVSIPHSDSYERWFFLAIDREDKEKAFEIAELTRRHRFQSTLPFGSRLISLRLLLEAPEQWLPQEFQLDKKDLAVEIPGFAALSAKSAALRKKISTLPIVPTTPEEVRTAKNLYSDWNAVAQSQESLLRLISMSRIKSPNVFPPFRTYRQFQQEIPDETVVLMFFETNGEYYGFLLGKELFEFWRIPNSTNLFNQVVKYLKSLGLLDTNRQQTLKDLEKEEWKNIAKQLLKELFVTKKEISFRELVIVPDGFLWYLPFETLQVEDKSGELRPLIGLVDKEKGIEPTIRYAPTAALAIAAKTSGHLGVPTTVFTGKLFLTDKLEVSVAAFERMKTEMQNLHSLSADQILVDPSLLAKQIRQLVVFDDIPFSKGGPYDWSPLPSTKALAQNGRLGNWLVLPWGGPKLLVLPGFHTAAEDAFKKGSNGDEIFFALTALQSCGVETILMSRWRPGGRSTFDLTSQFLKNLGRFPAGEAWRKAVFHVAGQPLIPEEEPRLKATGADKEKAKSLKANHPFFWGAFLLCDRSELPKPEEKTTPENAPVIDILDLDSADPQEDQIPTENDSVTLPETPENVTESP